MEKNLFHLVVNLPKEDSAFLYFLLEANEGLCFYSTLQHETGQSSREIDLKGTLEFKDEILRILDRLKETCPEILITLDETIEDINQANQKRETVG